jgi:hypothetical protein
MFAWLSKQRKQNIGEKMKRVISTFITLLMLGGLYAGCTKADKPKIEAAEQVKAFSADDGQDHSGHNH